MKPEQNVIPLKEAAKRLGVSEDEVWLNIQQGKLKATSRLDEVFVVWPYGEEETAQNNTIVTDAFANPEKADDPKWLVSSIITTWLILFGIAALWLLVTLLISASKN
ncbi:MAG TPA: hypothetical protein VF719_10580 [Abditibacteriaceae bacterium]|jgi:NADH:ubiquinone oxidoreductase subunit 6 (subunit J)